MTYVDKTWRDRPLEEEDKNIKAAIVEMTNRELTPLLKAMRAEVNRMGGNRRDLTSRRDILRTDRTIISAAAATLTMPPAADVEDQPFLFINAGTDNVNIVFSGTEQCSGATCITLTAQYVTVEIVSDGLGYFIAFTYP